MGATLSLKADAAPTAATTAAAAGPTTATDPVAAASMGGAGAGGAGGAGSGKQLVLHVWSGGPNPPDGETEVLRGEAEADGAGGGAAAALPADGYAAPPPGARGVRPGDLGRRSVAGGGGNVSGSGVGGGGRLPGFHVLVTLTSDQVGSRRTNVRGPVRAQGASARTGRSPHCGGTCTLAAGGAHGRSVSSTVHSPQCTRPRLAVPPYRRTAVPPYRRAFLLAALPCDVWSSPLICSHIIFSYILIIYILIHSHIFFSYIFGPRARQAFPTLSAIAGVTMQVRGVQRVLLLQLSCCCISVCISVIACRLRDDAGDRPFTTALSPS